MAGRTYDSESHCSRVVLLMHRMTADGIDDNFRSRYDRCHQGKNKTVDALISMVMTSLVKNTYHPSYSGGYEH